VRAAAVQSSRHRFRSDDLACAGVILLAASVFLAAGLAAIAYRLPLAGLCLVLAVVLFVRAHGPRRPRLSDEAAQRLPVSLPTSSSTDRSS